MGYSTCPGQDRRFWKPSDIGYETCPACGRQVEFWKDEIKRVCPGCGRLMINPRFDLGCAKWCPYAERCLGSIARAMVDQQGIMRDRLEAHVRRVLSKEPQCVNRTLDLVRLAERILQKQGGNALVIIVTAFVRGLPEKLANNVIGRVGLPDTVVQDVVEALEALQAGKPLREDLAALEDAVKIDAWVHQGARKPEVVRTETARQIIRGRDSDEENTADNKD